MSEAAVRTATYYTPGPWVGMAAARMWLVADLDHRDPAVAACWELVSQAAAVDLVLKALAAAQLRPVLNLAVLRLDDAGAEIVVRGEAWAEVAEQSAVDEVRTLRAEPGAFSDTKLNRFVSVSLRLAVETTAQQPLWTVLEGVVPVADLAIEAASSHQAPTESADRFEPVDATQPVASLENSEPEPTVGRFDALFGKTVYQPEAEQQAAVVPEEWMAGMRRGAAVPTGPAAGAQRPSPDTREQPAPDATASGTALFGDVTWAQVLDTPSTGPDTYDEYDAARPAAPAYPQPAVHPPASYPAPQPAPAGLLAATANGAAGIDPELLMTVQRAPAEPVATGPVVDAVRCAADHLNPSDAVRCRICGGVIPPQTPRPQARPRLGVLRLSTGEVVPLDRGVIVGRAPGAPAGFGRDEPYRIQVPSPDSSISRKHVEVELQGWTVTVVDLKSTNGTHIVPVDGPPQLLPPGGRRVIEHGWIVRLDERTSFRFEVTE